MSHYFTPAHVRQEDESESGTRTRTKAKDTSGINDLKNIYKNCITVAIFFILLLRNEDIYMVYIFHNLVYAKMRSLKYSRTLFPATTSLFCEKRVPALPLALPSFTQKVRNIARRYLLS